MRMRRELDGDQTADPVRRRAADSRVTRPDTAA
jgi:hypothetical protein